MAYYLLRHGFMAHYLSHIRCKIYMNKVILKQKNNSQEFVCEYLYYIVNSLIIHEENTKEIMRHERKAKGVCK